MRNVELFDHQREFLDDLDGLGDPARACLFFKTGSGKSLTAMLGMQALGYTEVLVIAPPSTHAQWVALGQELDVTVETMSHARFRMPDTKLSRTRAIIADEFHLFGGQQGQGWRKLDTLAKHLQAPLFLLSATPNYNDAERVYCITHILDPDSCKGGYLEFLYRHCETTQNPFGQTPNVLGFKNHASAADYLAALPKVFHLPDDLVISIQDVQYVEDLPYELLTYGYNRRSDKMVASQIEMTHTKRYQGLVGTDGYLRPDILTEVMKVLLKSKVTLIYANHATIAEVVARSLQRSHVGCKVVTGKTSKLDKDAAILQFGHSYDTLIGTATLATGTDGMDKVCDTLLILDDTEDDALRRQLIGRIMPRGTYISSAKKQVIRFTPI